MVQVPHRSRAPESRSSRRSHGLRLLAAILLLAASALPIQRDSIPALEEEVFWIINGWPEVLQWVFMPVMQLGAFFTIPILVALTLFGLKKARVAFDLAAAGMGAWVLAQVVKAVAGRGRPADLLEEVLLRGHISPGYGYISGHTAVAAAFATVVAAYVGWRGTFVVTALALAVGIGRIFVGAHLPLDVAGGAAMGWAVGSLVHFLVMPEVLGVSPAEAEALEGTEEATG